MLSGDGVIRQIGGTMNYDGNEKNLQQLLLAGGTLNANGPITNLTVSGGTLGGNGGLRGAINVGSGTLSGNKLLNGTLNWTNGTLSGSVVVAGNATMRWLGGTISGNLTVAPAGLLFVDGTSTRTLSGTLTNAGVLSWGGTNIWRMTANGLLVNDPAGTVEIMSDGTLQDFSGTPSIANAGHWRKSTGSGTTVVSVSLTNRGVIEVQSGTLSLNGGGEIDGSYNAAIGTTLQFDGGDWTLQPTALFGGLGTIRISGGNVTYAGSVFDLSTLQLHSGTLTVNGTITDFTMTGGTLAGNHSVTGTLNIGSGTLDGSTTVTGQMNWTNVAVSGGVAVTSNAVVRWYGGTVSGNLMVSPGGQVFVSGTSTRTLSGTLTNAGLVSWSDAAFWRMRDGGLLINEATGLVDILGDGTLQLFAGTANIDNRGLWRKSAGGGATTVSVPFTNTGLVEVHSGTLSFTGGGLIDGSYTAEVGTTLQFGSGNWILQPTTQFSGLGTVRISGGNVTYSGAFYDIPLLQLNSGTLTVNGTIADFTLSGGTLAGDHIVTGTLSLGSGTIGGATSISGLLNWTNGTVSGTLTITSNGIVRWKGGTISGSLMVATGGILAVVEGTAAHTLSGVLTNFGVVTWSDPDTWRMSGSGRLVNEASGLVDIDNDGGNLQLLTGTPAIVNAGLWRKSGNTGITTISVPFTNRGTIEARIGILQFSGPLVLSAEGSVSVPIGGLTPGLEFGQVTVQETFFLGGSLNVSLTGSFVPTLGDRFRILNWGSRRGGFDQGLGFDLGNNLYFQGIGDSSGLSLVIRGAVTHTPPPPTNLLDRVVALGDTAAFAFSPLGVEPLTYQWSRFGTNLPGQTNASLIIPVVQASMSGPYCAVVVDAFNLTNTYCADLIALIPPNVTGQPSGVTTNVGSSTTLSATAAGAGPLRYQWRINGANIPGATNPTYTLTNAQPWHGGIYSVLVANPVRVISSANAKVRIDTNSLPFADNFASRGTISGLSGTGSSSNVNATVQTGEPQHADKPGGRSVWLQWAAPAKGVATFDTRGSAFDTLLGIYLSTNATPSVTNLTAVDADEDRGGYFTSEAAFNAEAGTNYFIAVDGLGGRSEDIVLNWNLDTNLAPYPRIIQHPVAVTTTTGGNATFSVFALSTTNLTYQWHQDGWRAIAGATNSSLTLTNLSYLNVGQYAVDVTSASGQTVVSLPASLEIGPSADAQSFDKLEDLLAAVASGSNFINSIMARSNLTPEKRGRGRGPGRQGGGGRRIEAEWFPSVSVGTIGSQIINNFNSTTQQGEPIHSDVIGGSSRWYLLTAETNGTMVLDTLGSDIDTVLSVYTGTDIFTLQLVVQDNNGASDGVRSQVRFEVTPKTDYLIAVDGVNGAQGNIALNWRMGIPPNTTGPAQNLVVASGTNLLLHSSVSNNVTSPAYQWRRNGVNLAGATNATYTITSLRFDQVGSYSVLVSNLVGQVLNAIATVSADTALRLSAEPGGFRITGSAAQPTVMELSTNLAFWMPLYTNTTPLLPVSHLDTNAPARPAAFYRLLPWP